MQASTGGRGGTLPRTELDDDDDGYVSPEFDLSEDDESEGQQVEQQRPRRPFKKLRTDDGVGEGEGDDETLALKLLGRGR